MADPYKGISDAEEDGVLWAGKCKNKQKYECVKLWDLVLQMQPKYQIYRDKMDGIDVGSNYLYKRTRCCQIGIWNRIAFRRPYAWVKTFALVTVGVGSQFSLGGVWK